MHIDRTRAAELGRDTLQILQAGSYAAPSGHIVDLREAIDRARAGTETYTPGQQVSPIPAQSHVTQIAVINETTLSAANRLVAAGHRPVALNFASARHPGGGFLSGARAQEESIARSSALYTCLEGNPIYAWHQTHRSPFYSEYAIYSPDVPVFRDDGGSLLADPYLCAFITCPAVNAKVALERDPACRSAIRSTMAQRIERILAIAAEYRHGHLILGAWGCGVFGNDPREIADLFHAALNGAYQGAFAAVVFAILDWSPGRTVVGSFEQVFRGG